mmetsp:Transcript_5430/g.16171  ORF Transcript_5430/g.16171 Transcript_5430/m.16171 type:complete len:105 (+) Transcript_5430:945-1259(+)
MPRMTTNAMQYTFIEPMSSPGHSGDAASASRSGTPMHHTTRIRGVLRHLAWSGFRWIDFVGTFKWRDGYPISIVLQIRSSVVEKSLLWDREGKQQELVANHPSN